MDSKKVDYDCLTYYLNRILSFLTSQKTSQVFPGLSKDVEDILVKVVGPNDLELQGFDDDFKTLFSLIRSVIEGKKGEYRLSCDFKDLSCGTRSLIYTKIMIPITFLQHKPLRKPNSMSSNKELAPASSDLITQSFKLRCLNATLKFVKDESRMSFRYPEMATVQAQHIVGMFQNNVSDGDLRLGYKTLYAPLHEAMKTFGQKYKFTLRHIDPKDKNMKSLVLDKIPICVVTNTSNNKETLDQRASINYSTSIDDSQDNMNTNDISKSLSKISLMDISDDTLELNGNNSFTLPEKPKRNTSKSPRNIEIGQGNARTSENNSRTTKKTRKLNDIIKLLGDNYMMDTFTKILDFVMDKTAASLRFGNVSAEEVQILTSWRFIMDKAQYRILLSSDCMFVICQLKHNLNQMDFSININGKRRYNVDNKRDIIFNKIPLGESVPSVEKHRGSLTSLNSGNSIEENAKPSADKVSLRITSANEMSHRCVSVTGPSASRVSLKITSVNEVSARSVSVTRSSVSQASANEISTKSSSANQISKGNDVPRQTSKPTSVLVNCQATNAGNTKESNEFKLKLLEGLEQPVNSDKAMKMMLNMGWQGGALGSRGEGITEPIRPSLDIPKRQGLGAPIPIEKPKLPDSPSKIMTKMYHAETLKLILNLLTSEANSKEITFPVPYMRKEWEYVKNVVILFNRNKYPNTPKKTFGVAEEIVEILYETDWVLTAGLMTDRITIVIKKSILPLFPKELKLYCEVAAFAESQISRDGTFKDIYRAFNPYRNKTRAGRPDLNGLWNSTKEVIKESTVDQRSDSKDQRSEQNDQRSISADYRPVSKDQRSGPKDQKSNLTDQNKNKAIIDVTHKTLVVPIGSWIKMIKEDKNKTRKIEPDKFKNDVLQKILQFCQTNVKHKLVEFDHDLTKKQRIFIRKCIEKVNANTPFLDPILEKFYDRIIAAKDGYKIDLVFCSPSSVSLEKDQSHMLTPKNSNNNVTIHHYVEDIESDDETKDVYLDPEQSFVDDDACNNDETKIDRDDQKTNANDKKGNVRRHNKVHDIKPDTNNIGISKIPLPLDNNEVPDTKNNVVINKSDQVDTPSVIENQIKHITNNKIKTEQANDLFENDNANVEIPNKYQMAKADDSKTDDEVSIIENKDLTITIGSDDDGGDDSLLTYLLRSDTENDISISTVIEKVKGKTNLHNNLDNHNTEQQPHNVVKVENKPIQVKNDLESHVADVEASEPTKNKRSRSNSQNSLQDPKKLKLFCKTIAIVPENYPQTKMDDEKARVIQTLLIDAINNDSGLPLLKCYGIKNGTLIYSCHTEKTFNLLEKIVNKANLKIIYEIVTEKLNKKMAFRISTFIEETTSDILNRLVKFNEGLNIDHWVVIKKELHKDFVVIYVNVDNRSYCYLKDVNFSLYAGVDVAVFTHVWD